jgi:hypothetical protein
MNRLDSVNQLRNSDEVQARHHLAGWSIGDLAVAVEGGGIDWVVSGLNREDFIRAGGATRDEALIRSVE